MQTPALGTSRPRWPFVIAATVSAGYLLLDPARHACFPPCPLYAMTGWYCPGCGSQRALHQLLHGHFGLALRYNALFVMSIPTLLGLFLVLSKEPTAWRERIRRHGGTLFILCVVVALLFGLVRNVPVAPFNGLAPPTTIEMVDTE